MILTGKRISLTVAAAVAIMGTGIGAAYAGAAITAATVIQPKAAYACEGGGHVVVTLLSSPSRACPAGTTSIVLGAQGPKGAQGLQGIQGLTGVQGPKGDTGAQGLPGTDGLPGPKGDAGPQGLPGADGAQGPKGDTGLTGDTGPAGPKGDTGAQGLQGIQGPKGDTGAAAPAPDFGVASVLVNRGSGASAWAVYSAPLLGSPAGDQAQGAFRFTCPSSAPGNCALSLTARATATGWQVYPRVLIMRQVAGSGPEVYCEYGDGADNNGAKAALTTTDAAVTLGIGGSLDCGAGQAYPANGIASTIEVPNDGGHYDVYTTLIFSKAP